MNRLNFSPFPELATKNLVLRKISDEDINEFYILKSDPRLLIHYEANPRTFEETKKKLKIINEDMRKNEVVLWGITLKGDDKVIGSICFWNISEDELKAEIGYELMVEWQGKGVIQEAIQAVIKYGFDQMELQEIEAVPISKNIRSVKLLEKFNFVRRDTMKISDLSHTICSDMPVYPGTEGPVFEKANTVEKDGFCEAKITMYSHTGTHIDAPAHMLTDGPYLDDLSIEQFIGKATILDFSDGKNQFIDLDSVKAYEKIIRKVDFVIIKTGWDKYWGDEKYYGNFPSLTEEAAMWLSDFKLKGIGIDAISIDEMNTTTFSTHKIFMAKNIIIIENLTNLDSISSEIFILSILPMKNKKADGSPVRAVAIENTDNKRVNFYLPNH